MDLVLTAGTALNLVLLCGLKTDNSSLSLMIATSRYQVDREVYYSPGSWPIDALK